MNRETKISLQILGVVVVALATGIALILPVTATKNVPVQEASSHDVVHIKVNQGGYFLPDGKRITEGLELPRGHHVKIVFHYAYAADTLRTTPADEPPVHQFTIQAGDNGKDLFRLQSKPLSPENPVVEMELDVGRDGIAEYKMYCDINCNAMVQLFQKIVVIG